MNATSPIAPPHHVPFFAEPATWVGISFILFFILFGPMMWRSIVRTLDNRAANVRTELDEAARLKREAHRMLVEATSRREQATAEAARLIEGARTEAARITEAAAEDARMSVVRRERMATERIAAAEKAAVTEVRTAATEIATRAATAVMASTLDAEADATLIDGAIARLPAALARRAA